MGLKYIRDKIFKTKNRSENEKHRQPRVKRFKTTGRRRKRGENRPEKNASVKHTDYSAPCLRAALAEESKEKKD